MSLLTTLWEWIKSIFLPHRRAGTRASDEMFVPIDVEDVRKRFRLLEEAHRFGENELPATDDVELDGPQKRVRQFITESINDAFRRGNVELERLRSALRSRDVSRVVKEIEEAPAHLQNRVRRRLEAVDQQISSLEREQAQLLERIEKFRDQFDFEREPELIEPWQRRLMVAGVMGLGLLQAIANTIFFAQGSRWGLSAGLAFAFVLGVFDIFVHFSGGLGLRGLRSPVLVDRFLGFVSAALVLFTVPAWNLGIVHLRTSVRNLGFDAGLELWLSSYLEAPLGFTDFTSIALLAVGLACSISAIVAGLKWDEPIALLRKTGHKLQDIEIDLARLRQARHEIEYEERAAIEQELEAMIEKVDRDVSASEAVVGRMKRLRENLTVFVDDAEKGFQTLIQMYRDENRIARSTPPPSYFHERPVLKTDHPLDLDMEDLESRLEQQVILLEKLQRVDVLGKLDAAHER